MLVQLRLDVGEAVETAIVHHAALPATLLVVMRINRGHVGRGGDRARFDVKRGQIAHETSLKRNKPTVTLWQANVVTLLMKVCWTTTQKTTK